MKAFKFNLDFIEDLYAYGLVFAAAELFQFMSDELKKGNAVILVRSAKDDQPAMDRIIRQAADLEQIHASIRQLSIPINQSQEP
jgi:hypothetical protein